MKRFETNGKPDVAIMPLPGSEGESSPTATLDDVTKILRGIRETLAANQVELLDAEATCTMLGISRSTLDRLRDKGELPEPIILAGSIKRWRRRDLVKWIESGCVRPS